MVLHERGPFNNLDRVSWAQKIFFYVVVRDISFPASVKKVADTRDCSLVDFSINFYKFESIRSSLAITKNRLSVSIILALIYTLRSSSVQRKPKPRRGTIKLFIWNNVISTMWPTEWAWPAVLIRVVIIYSQLGSCLLFSSGFITAGMWLSFFVFLVNWSSGVYYYLSSDHHLLPPSISFLPSWPGTRAGSCVALLSFILCFTFGIWQLVNLEHLLTTLSSAALNLYVLMVQVVATACD